MNLKMTLSNTTVFDINGNTDALFVEVEEYYLNILFILASDGSLINLLVPEKHKLGILTNTGKDRCVLDKDIETLVLTYQKIGCPELLSIEFGMVTKDVQKLVSLLGGNCKYVAKS